MFIFSYEMISFEHQRMLSIGCRRGFLFLIKPIQSAAAILDCYFYIKMEPRRPYDKNMHDYI